MSNIEQTALIKSVAWQAEHLPCRREPRCPLHRLRPPFRPVDPPPAGLTQAAADMLMLMLSMLAHQSQPQNAICQRQCLHMNKHDLLSISVHFSFENFNLCNRVTSKNLGSDVADTSKSVFLFSSF
ncbi:unnamed protein product [Toxocara canis]|uniref:Uncharacterized protein n=1 Tax=Toxocara canis TaxID=6265 RepID=A0A183UBU1_TOXCA|nr:unnamed protein product [Toxocara canis]